MLHRKRRAEEEGREGRTKMIGRGRADLGWRGEKSVASRRVGQGKEVQLLERDWRHVKGG